MQVSSIGWCDYSGGPANIVLRGSTPGDCEVSAGCAECYMLALHRRFGCLPDETSCYPEKLDRLARLRLPKHSPKRGVPHRPMVFVVDGGDLFHPSVPNSFIASALDLMASREDVNWQVLTKRPERFSDILCFMDECWPGDSAYNVAREVIGPPPHIWLGVSIENQARADERIPLLLQMPATVCFLSVEPMLEPVDLNQWLPWLDWVICGAESGPNRRPFNVQWALDLYRQCRETGVPFFYKQGSALRPGCNAHLPGYGVVQEWPRV